MLDFARNSTGVATYEIVLDRTAVDAPADVVEDLPLIAQDEVLFYKGNFWHVDAVKPARSAQADGRLVVSRTTDEPDVHTAYKGPG